ncbi:MAG: hypothetical protein RL769_238 [Pseudomonadota bacterium]|jgi:hypothetical protein
MAKTLTKIKLIISLTIFFFINCCGFQVVYKEQNLSSSISHELATIAIQKDRTQISQQLRKNLYDNLNPDYIKTDKKFLLVIDLKQSISPTFITTTGASGRNRVTLIATYQLKDIANAKEVAKGSSEVSDNYDVSLNRYATNIAEDYVKNNLTKLLAQNIRDMIINDLVELRKKCQDLKNDDEICQISKE